jgi:hypothetical protein
LTLIVLNVLGHCKWRRRFCATPSLRPGCRSIPAAKFRHSKKLNSATKAALNSLHTQANDQQSGIFSGGVQKSFGLLTLELGIPYERGSDSDDTAQGIGNTELSARYPLYQRVPMVEIAASSTCLARGAAQ